MKKMMAVARIKFLSAIVRIRASNSAGEETVAE